MGDSDDEHDRRNGRDKFRHERNDYEKRGDDRRPAPPPQTWEERAHWANRRGGAADRREGYRDYDRRPRYSPQREGGSPPHVKRMRGEWEEGFPPRFDMPPYMGGPMHGHPPPPNPHLPPPPGAWGGHPAVPGDLPAPPHLGGALPTPGQKGAQEADIPTQPQMMSFKLFLQSQPDDITEVEAVKKYSDYMADFRRHQISEFFLQHKEQEWFRYKYHPEEFSKREEANRKSIQNRCNVFCKLLELNLIESVSLNITFSSDILRFLDAAVILMEGGTEFDLKVLDIGNNVSDKPVESEPALTATSTLEVSKVVEPDSTEAAASIDIKEEPMEAEKPTEEKSAEKPSEEKTTAEESGGNSSEEKAGEKASEEKSDDISDSGSLADSDEEKEEERTSTEQKDEKKLEVGQTNVDEPEEGEDVEEPKPRALHKTLSVFFRNLAPTITRQEIEEVCKRYPGYLRVALQDPLADRKFTRRGWATFSGKVNIKDICWNLQSVKIKGFELGAILNSELKQRVRTVAGITSLHAIAHQDLKQSVKIIQKLDRLWNLWEESTEKKDEEKDATDVSSKNPLLQNISALLTDEVIPIAESKQVKEEPESGEEKMEETTSDATIDVDNNLLKALDKLILYLRIVHSIDYYSTTEYAQEDVMPHRCGIIHVRGALPTGKINETEVNDWISSFEQRIKPFIDSKTSLDDSEMLKFGRKDIEQEVEKFIKANTQEISKEKWLCPLSGKKFKGPDFVKKHILSKHADKVEEVKNEVMYFNNYLRDPKRPELPEHPAGKQLPPPRDARMPSMYPGGLPPPPPPHMGYRHPGPPPAPGHHHMYPGSAPPNW